MSPTNERESESPERWVFGLEEIPAWDEGEDGEFHPVAPAYSRCVVRAPEGTPQALVLAADEFVAQCGPDGVVQALMLRWLKIEIGDETEVGVESCTLERVDGDRIRLQAHFQQWEELTVPVADVRRMLVDLADFVITESRHPLPAWRILRLGERKQPWERAAE